MKKLVIIPAFNESGSIVDTVEDIRKNAPEFDYIVINDSLEECVEEIHRLVDAARRAPVRRKELIGEIREELKGFVKGAE